MNATAPGGVPMKTFEVRVNIEYIVHVVDVDEEGAERQAIEQVSWGDYLESDTEVVSITELE
jgi:hypothetical protein